MSEMGNFLKVGERHNYVLNKLLLLKLTSTSTLKRSRVLTHSVKYNILEKDMLNIFTDLAFTKYCVYCNVDTAVVHTAI